MTNEERISEYAKATYPSTFKKKTVIRDGRGKIVRTEVEDINPIVIDSGSFLAR